MGEVLPGFGEASPNFRERFPNFREAFPDWGEGFPEIGGTFPRFGGVSPNLREVSPDLGEVFPGDSDPAADPLALQEGGDLAGEPLDLRGDQGRIIAHLLSRKSRPQRIDSHQRPR